MDLWSLSSHLLIELFLVGLTFHEKHLVKPSVLLIKGGCNGTLSVASSGRFSITLRGRSDSCHELVTWFLEHSMGYRSVKIYLTFIFSVLSLLLE